MNTRVDRRYMRRLLGYVLANKGLLTLVFAMGVIGFSITFIYPWLIGSLIDDVIAPKSGAAGLPSMAQRMHRLWSLVTIAAITAVLFGISGYGRGHFNVKLGNRIVAQLRHDLFDHLQKLSLHFYSKERTGGIVWRLIQEVHGVNGLIHAGIVLVALDAMQLIIALILLMQISPRLTFAVLGILPLYILTFKIFNPAVRRTSERVQQHLGKLSGNVQEQLSAVALIRSYASEDRESDRFMRENAQHLRHVVAQSRVGHAVGAISESLIHIGTTIIIGYGGYLALTTPWYQRPLSAGDITRFLGYVGIMYGPLRRCADLNLVYQSSLASIRRVFRVFDIAPKIREKPGARTASPARGSVRYESVRFHYNDDSDETRARLDDDPVLQAEGDNGSPQPAPEPAWVLDGVSLEVSAGECVALVGPSGSGKTTLGALLPRLYDPIEGNIFIDDINIRDYSLKALRRAIGIVQQEAFLFSGTVRDNLMYGRPDASIEQVVAAAQAANAHEFITRLPGGYDAPLGERGVNLSGGQRQRLSIARALLKDPRILILDEATSALDTESEMLVQQALDRLMEGRTCLIIAHRLSTVRHADRILALQHGRIVEAGRHDELVARDGLYARLVRHQFGLAAARPSLQHAG